ncbi:hypothetical protein NP233_g9666 [Leucocoprinus birnbaumii]|uniref:Phosphoglucomutase n=1 Tax=Leucocoprinus birnbaumii TaxID=56174 RepID=A0AAD5YMY3_9AGAR|nr:hypothetical protein NP233_g9666 [Leucocoprinus birnbaumii]
MIELRQLVHQWLLYDLNPSTREEIQSLWEEGNIEELEKRMRHRIQFGTAGLRGKMEAGWGRMNDFIIIQTSQGLASYVAQQIPDAGLRGVIIGHDHRFNSDRWAKLTAVAFLDKGIRVYLLRGNVHTPMVPFAVKRKKAACGVMITASHNPKDDNGYKIIDPHDRGISQSIYANLRPIKWDTNDALTHPRSFNITHEMHEEYFESLSSLLVNRSLNNTTPVRFVNTSMHGVSDRYIRRAFETFGFAPYVPVREQQMPDPKFPTVRFPNPEEKGALDLALATAEREGISYVLAQDPDSDRFAGAERDRYGNWTVFTGDQLGSLFASHTLEIYKRTGKPLNKLAMVASTVSSKMIEAMAQVEGFKFVECLTGFKYIGNTALDLVRQGYEVPFGYEEAIGFMFGNEIRDKDGVAATMVFVQLAAALNAQGRTLKDYLQSLYERYGYFQTNNGYFICNDPPTIDRIFARLRSFDPRTPNLSYPGGIAGLATTSVVDLTVGYDSRNAPSYKPTLPLSSGHMIQFRAENKEGMKIVLTTRTSGTEPKIKYYLEGSGRNFQAVKDLLVRVVQELGDVWFEADRWGLKRS